jgi:hypothetical protein
MITLSGLLIDDSFNLFKAGWKGKEERIVMRG